MPADSPQQQPVDRLTSLPTELFEIICRDAQADPSCPDLGLVSKAFLHVARQRRFETVRLKSYRQLDELCGMTHLHGYIQSLEIQLRGLADYYGVPSANRLKRLIQGLTSVQSLYIGGSPRIAKVFLAPPSTMTLPALVDLKIDGSFDRREDFPHPFSPELYASIKTYAKLSRLSVTVGRALPSRQLPSEYSKYTGKPIPTLGGDRSWTIRLHGPLAESTAALDLISSFKIINALHLRNIAGSDSLDFGSLVDSIKSPQQVQHLELGGARTFASNLLNSNAENLLARLPHLKTIAFGGSVFQGTLLSTLATLTDLRKVIFTADADNVTDAGLSAMLDGPQRLSQVRIVHIDVHFPYDYRWRTMRPALSVDGTMENVKLAEKHGIRLEGTTIDVARKEMESRGDL